jgi:hypothetical protein
MRNICLVLSGSPRMMRIMLVSKISTCFNSESDLGFTDYLKSALECLMESGATLTETLPLMERVRKATPLMKNIWETSGMALCGRDAALQAVISFEEGVQKQLKDGTLTMNDSVTMPHSGNL